MKPLELDARLAWNEGADAYAQFIDSGADYYRHLVHGPALLAACGDVAGRRVLDVGCGHGFFSRLLARGGATVVGADVSDALLARAAAGEAAEPLGVTYQQMDAAEIGGHFPEASFDLITGCMSFQDIADPAAVLAGVGRLLRLGGRVVFSIPHPCTDTLVRRWRRDDTGRKAVLELDRYFDTGPAVCDWSMPRLKYPWRTPYRRFTLAEWVSLIRAAGLVVLGLTEPRPDAALVAANPDLEDCARMPYFLVFEAGVKPVSEYADPNHRKGKLGMARASTQPGVAT